MSTRSAYGWIINGVYEDMYVHSDGYPTWQGVQVGMQLRECDSLDKLRERIMRARRVEAQDKYTSDDLNALTWEGYPTENMGGDEGTYYNLLRGIQGNLPALAKVGMLPSTGGHFLMDSLFCEWGYVLDFDARQLVVLEGYNKDLDRQPAYCRADKPDQSGYCACFERLRIDFDKVRTGEKADYDLVMKGIEASVYEDT